jgi:hypothetical protein
VSDVHARRVFAATALAVGLGLVIQLFVAADNTTGHFTDATARVLNVFTFFTIQSNILVGVATLLLAIRLDRTSLLFRVVRMMGMVGIVVTAIVYHVAIRAFLHLDSWALAADHTLHLVVPVLAVYGWLRHGPRGLASPQVARLTVLFPLAYFAFSIVRGAIIDWYPYTFVDVTTLGYLKVLLNAVWIALLVFGVAAGATALDARLARSDREPSAS